MKTFKHLALIIGLVVIGGLSSAAAEEMQFSYQFAGTFLTIRIDSNNDGVLAAHGTGSGEGDLGPFIFSSVFERQPVADPTSVGCQAGQAGFELVVGNVAHTYADTSQLFLQPTESPLCVDLTTGMITGPPFANTILGGTGRFAGATGSITGSASGFITLIDTDPESNQFFGVLTSTVTGVINIPDGGVGPLDCNNDGVVNGLDVLGIGCP